MIDLDLAHALRGAGLTWTPTPGDRFVVPDRDLDEDVFVISDIAPDLHDVATDTVIGFNGTTEWTLDSITQQAALWLPREHQLRELLGASFVRLEQSADGFTVVALHDDEPTAYADPDVESAYAKAVLAALG